MKIERLLAIVTYLLNRDLVSGKQLAERFEVSERTIQRDIESINMAGIPIISFRGSNGGYQIWDTYKLSKQTSTNDDLNALKIALESLNTAIDHKKISNTLEKVNALGASSKENPISVDFGIAKENSKVVACLKNLEKAIQDKKRVEFDYINASNQERHYTVEPVNLKFKWYAWYLVGYSIQKEQYRIFKLSRMKDLVQIKDDCSIKHDSGANLFDEIMKYDTRAVTTIFYKCKKQIYSSFESHFHNSKITSEDELHIYGTLDIVESERLWFALILSFGDDVEIIEPEPIRKRLYEHVKKIMAIFEIPDS